MQKILGIYLGHTAYSHLIEKGILFVSRISRSALRFFGTYSLQNVIKQELIMISINTSLMIILVGTVILMIGVMLFREPSKSIRSTCNECVVWGVGFFLSMSVQVALIASMS